MIDVRGEMIRDIVGAMGPRDWTVPITVGIAGPIGHGKSTLARMLAEKFGHVEIAFADHLRRVCAALLGLPYNYLVDRALKSAPLVGFDNGYVFPFDHRDPAAVNRQLDVALAVAYGTAPDVFTYAPAAASLRGTVLVGADKLRPGAVRTNALVQFMRHVWIPLRNGRIFSPREVLQLVGTEVLRAVDPGIWIWAWNQQADSVDLVVTPDFRFPNELEMLRARHALLVWVERPGHDVDTRHVSETLLDKTKLDAEIINDGTLDDLWRALHKILVVYAKAHKSGVDSGYAKLVTA